MNGTLNGGGLSGRLSWQKVPGRGQLTGITWRGAFT